MRYDLVIFDNDGVLVDSEPISNKLLAGYLTELGHPTSYEESLREYMGSAMHRVHDLVEERTGQRLPENFDDVFHGRVFAAFERELEPVPGAVEVVEKLAADGVPYCVASSGSLALVTECVVRIVGAYTLPVDTMVWLGNVIMAGAVVLAIRFGGRLAVGPMERMVEDELVRGRARAERVA
ncbi:HAD family hydrolase [Streptomyces sp. NPDC056949]|uniref:HAD family hydrolase n=1 Tax=Streptomyces sp. NPDC056949 TaxID=3345976 RepID=UPI00363C9E70